MTHDFFLRRLFPSTSLAASVAAVLYVVIMVLMSMSSSLCPLSGANLPLSLLEKCRPHIGPSTPQDQFLVLASLAFSSSSNELKKRSSPGHGHFLCLLQESYLTVLWMLTADRKRFFTKMLSIWLWCLPPRLCHVHLLDGL